MTSMARRRKATDEDLLDQVFHALADRTRRALLARLAHGGPSNVTSLAAPFAMTRPAVSKHLAVLEAARLVERTVDGRVHRCSHNAEMLRTIDAWLERYRSFWNETLDNLERYAEEDGRPPTGGGGR